MEKGKPPFFSEPVGNMGDGGSFVPFAAAIIFCNGVMAFQKSGGECQLG
jgi:hypothetical protein